MSLNVLTQRTYIPELEALRSVLNDYVRRWKVAQTVEDRDLIEEEALEVLQKLVDLDFSMPLVKVGWNPETNEWLESLQTIDFLSRNGVAKVKKVSDQYLKYFNNERISLLRLTSHLRRIRQKRAALSLRDTETVKYSIMESFLTHDQLSGSFNAVKECTLDTVQGALLLPVRQTTNLRPTKIKIGAESNGRPGNSDVEVQTNNAQPDFMFNDSPVDWFEYERLDAGPCELILVCEFSQEQIVNQIAIEPINLGFGLSFSVVDIQYQGANGGSSSIWSLIDPMVDVKAFEINPIGNDVFWRLSHIPVMAKTITLRLSQPHSYPISILSADDREVLRPRFAIAIKNIAFFKVEYESIGGIASTPVNLPRGLFGCGPGLIAFPEGKLWSTTLSLTDDGGETWSSDLFAGGIGLPKTVVLDGNGGEFAWRMTVARNDASFNGLTNLTGTEVVKKTKGILKGISRFQSPIDIPLSDRPLDGVVHVIQPKVMRRGDRYGGYRLGETTGIAGNLRLPTEIISRLDDLDQVKILVNNQFWEHVDDDSQLGVGFWCFSPDFKEITFDDSAQAGSVIKLVLDEERCFFEERSDGYYHRMIFGFDPEPENILVQYLPRSPIRKSVVLSRTSKIINLASKGIHNDLVLSSETGVTYTEVMTRAEVLDTEDGQYFVDYQNGILYLARKIAGDNVRANFTHTPVITVPPDKVSVVYEGLRPWGIRVSKDAMEAIQHTDITGQDPVPVFQIKELTHEAKVDGFVGFLNKKTLSHDHIIRGSIVVSEGLFGVSTILPKEVEYVDGKTEFFDLLQMTNEMTVETVAGADTVSFTLAAGSAVYLPLKVTFSDTTTFATLVGSLGAVTSTGKYFISTMGVVTVWIGTGGTLNGGIQITYSYRNPEQDPARKYSVDYLTGVFYCDRDMSEDKTISYKTAVAQVSYDVAIDIPDPIYLSDANSVRIRTEGMHEINSLVKVLWNVSTETTIVDQLKNYFSPIITLIGFRFD